MKQLSVQGTAVLLVDAGGELFACQALCPHEAVPLERGTHDGRVLTCHEHRWQFDLRTGAPIGDALAGLQRYRVAQTGHEIYVDVRGTEIAASL